ncbi:MAG: archaeal heat shock protein Hsp20 [Candidatus Thorarchaeota archaeon]
MSWYYDDDDEDPRKELRKWFGEFLPEGVFAEIDKMMERMMRQMRDENMLDRKSLNEFIKQQGQTNPFVFGFSMSVGPDGQPVIKKFGNTDFQEKGTPRAGHYEPLVDVIDEKDEIIVVAELPGVDKDDIKVRVKGQHLTIHVDNPNKPYYKEVELPSRVMKEDASSSIRNGVLEIRLKKA